jgi:translation elongation factor EF-G
VADKTSICDTEPEEQEKGHTLQLAVVQGNVQGRAVDVARHAGLRGLHRRLQRALVGADVVVGVHSAAGKVTTTSARRWSAQQALGRGRVVIVTHLDDPNCDFDMLATSSRARSARSACRTSCPTPAVQPSRASLRSLAADRTAGSRT